MPYQLFIRLCLCVLLIFPSITVAQAQSEQLIYNLTPDKIETLDLPAAAGSTIIGNEQHLNIFFDTKNRAVLVPRSPGASYFKILGQNGDILAQGHALIAAPKDNYVRIRRSCHGSSANNAASCRELDVYYCPGICHNIALQNSTSSDDAADPSAP